MHGLYPSVFRCLLNKKTSQTDCSSPHIPQKKLLQHAHVQGLSKTARTVDQRCTVTTFPPLPDKLCLINIEIIPLYNRKDLILQSKEKDPGWNIHTAAPRDLFHNHSITITQFKSFRNTTESILRQDYSRIYFSTNSTASTYISGVMCFSFAFPVTRLMST